MTKKQRTLTEQLWLDIHGNTPNADETEFYWRKLFESVHGLAGDEHSRTNVDDHFCDIAVPLTQSAKLQGWRLGIGFALNLMAETMGAPEKSEFEACESYREFSTPLKNKV